MKMIITWFMRLETRKYSAKQSKQEANISPRLKILHDPMQESFRQQNLKLIIDDQALDQTPETEAEVLNRT